MRYSLFFQGFLVKKTKSFTIIKNSFTWSYKIHINMLYIKIKHRKKYLKK